MAPLKRGGRLHHNLAPNKHKNSRFVCEDTVSNCDLYMIQWYPGVDDGDGIVGGEVYEIDEPMLARMDELEDEGILYRRTLKTTQSGHDVWIYMYLGDVDPASKVVSGIFDVASSA
ncbi:Gamma-glutamyl cyclotransferase [Fragilaria crotonensis]|nr:Gamma-glutamyl cyclotransferase [Fragilaria crotonensis]